MVTIRTYRTASDDADRLLDFINAGYRPRVVLTSRGLQRLLTTPGYQPERDLFLATTGVDAPELLAARDVRVTGRGDEAVQLFESWGLGAATDNQEVGTALLDITEQRAIEHLAESGRSEGILQVRCSNDAVASSELLVSRGFVFARPLMSMIHRNPHNVTPSSVPESVTIRTYRKGEDDARWVDAFNDAFSDHWGGFMGMSLPRWQHAISDDRFDPLISLVAEGDGQIAGFCHNLIDRELNAINRRQSGMVRYVGVTQRWRGVGLGSALTRLGIAAIVAAGMDEVDISVDAENTTNAHRLYERLGFEPTNFESIYRKCLSR